MKFVKAASVLKKNQLHLPGDAQAAKRYMDFLLQPTLNPARSARWKVLELKRPTDCLISGPRRNRGFSSKVTAGIRQLQTYAALLERHPEHLVSKVGHKVSHPRLALLIGRADMEDPEVLSREQARTPQVEMLHYDEIEEIQMRRLSALFDLDRLI